jgi:hypothetical protein
MKISLEITPDDTLTEQDFSVMCELAESDGQTPDQWAAIAIRKAIYTPATDRADRRRDQIEDPEAA